MRARDVLNYLAEKAPPVGGEEGFRYGDPGQSVERVLVCWMATLDAIRRAAEERCQLMIVHEDLLFPPDFGCGAPHQFLGGPVNRRRLTALTAAGITVLRAHGMLDRLCILDDFGKVLGLGEPVIRERSDRVYEIEPVPFLTLCSHVKERLGAASLRVTGDPERIVRRIGLPWGGLGLSINAGFVHRMLEYEPDALISGESDDYVFRACADAGVGLIETSHAESENPGLRHFAEALAADLAPLEVIFYENPRPWSTFDGI